MPRTLRRWSFLKKSPRHLGDDPGGPPEGHPDRAVVAGRGPCRPEEQDCPSLGPTGHPAPRPARSADEFGLHLRGDLPATGQGRGLGPAPMRYAGHEPAPGGSRAGRGSRSPWGHADGPGRMAPHQGSRRARQSHAGAVASPSARVEPGREHLAVSARELVVEPRVRLLPQHRRSLLRRLEPPHRPALAHHVHRPPELGQCMIISAGWYYAGAFVYGRRQASAVTSRTGRAMKRPRPMQEWRFVVKDRYPAYIDWATYEKIRSILSDNRAEYMRNKTRGAPRDGDMLLHGIVWCGRCGHKMFVRYKGGGEYVCNHLHTQRAAPVCQHIRADVVDNTVAQAFLAALAPAEIEALSQAHRARQKA